MAATACPDAAVIARDLDGRPERRASFDIVMRCFPPAFPVVYAGPQPEIEAWILAGYEPVGDEERRRLAEIAAGIGFSPTAEPERLTSTTPDHPRDGKRICDHLTAESEARQSACLDDLALLRSRGAACGFERLIRKG